VIQKGWYKPISRTQVNCNRIMALKDFASWLADFPTGRGAIQERLIRTVEAPLNKQKEKQRKSS